MKIMKKLFLIIILIIAANVGFAQVTLGPMIGFSTSKLSIDKNDIKSDLKNSFQFGAFVRIGRNIYVQPEINFLTQGSVFKSPGLVGGLSPFEQEVDLKTIRIPLLLGVKVSNKKVVNVRIFGGPSASIIADKKIKTTSGTGWISPIKDANIEDLIWNIQVGAGVDVLMFTLDVKYNIGLNKVIGDVEIDGNTVKFDSKSNGFCVTLGWKIF